MLRPVVFGAGVVAIITNSALFIFIRCNRNLYQLSSVLLLSMLINGFLWGLYEVIRFGDGFSFKIGILCVVLYRFGQALFISLNLHSCVIISERYFAIAYPFRYNRFSTIGHLSIIIVLVWLVPTAVPIFSIIDGIFSKRLANCSLIDVQQFIRIDYICHLIMLILATLLLVLLLIMYGRIIYLLKLRQYNRVAFVSTRRHFSSIERLLRGKLALRKKAVIQAMIVFTFYAVFLIPFLTLSTIALSDIYRFADILQASVILRDVAFCYPALQPLIYAYFTADIRKEICVVYHKIVKSTRFQGTISRSITRVSGFNGRF
ncbi:uncharacterized protein TRIADDRAFT_57081 [Trichoplax adhaerens]|uniref:G-protein coupled receptors family 1 profile domain-containing protein n=1 Tax=Trichoplax adhaerens TaxID=10228 RepID=B3S0K3_TRIAD|nr:hypothetical protein TRIADDRAFT_57081 [Trichoplax adhaerens]EDV24024.1 hypothetical protein TRIADDRAFT_57081 [Trichoplax adhaerens]|eukprot:XP_002113550.1 hypothetical protein TRIADDRAFT_57081 [Trichoplax adhaerens]